MLIWLYQLYHLVMSFSFSLNKWGFFVLYNEINYANFYTFAIQCHILSNINHQHSHYLLKLTEFRFLLSLQGPQTCYALIKYTLSIWNSLTASRIPEVSRKQSIRLNNLFIRKFRSNYSNRAVNYPDRTVTYKSSSVC